MKIPYSEFNIRECTEGNLDAVLELQEETIARLPSEDLLRRNSPQMFLSCFKPPHLSIGAWYGEELAAICILYVPEDNAEDLAHLLDGIECAGMRTANYKLCIVREKYRGNGLQYHLGELIENEARKQGIALMCTTVSPDNPHSIRNMLSLGYRYNRTLEKYGYSRSLYYKFL